MLATLAIATALSLTPAQDGKLELSNARTTFGFLGNIRENNKYLPGDVLFLAFDIKGMSVGKSGDIKYSLALDMRNDAGVKVFGQLPQVIASANSLGGTSLPGYAYADIGSKVAPGKYTLTVTVEDAMAKKSAKLDYQFEVLKKDFGIGRLGMWYDDRGQTWAPPVFVAGQSVWIHFITMGFDRNAATKQPDVEVRMRVLDESGKATLPQTVAGDTKTQKVQPEVEALPWFQKIELNRPGKYKLELEAEDKVAKKTVKEVLNITVLETK